MLVRHEILTLLVCLEILTLLVCHEILTLLVCLAVLGDGRRREQCSESWLRLKQDRARHESKKRQNREAAKRYRDKAKRASLTMGTYGRHHAASLYGLYPSSASDVWPQTMSTDASQSHHED